jgi:hypothetical protein
MISKQTVKKVLLLIQRPDSHIVRSECETITYAIARNCMHGEHFIASLTLEALSHREPETTGIPSDG